MIVGRKGEGEQVRKWQCRGANVSDVPVDISHATIASKPCIGAPVTTHQPKVNDDDDIGLLN